MVGLILKVLSFFAFIIFAVLMVLNVTNVWNPGTLAANRPDVEPCRRYAEANFKDRMPHLIEVRWIMTAENYGWGCHFEYDISTVETVSPMPK